MAEDNPTCFVLFMRHRSSQPDGQRDVLAVAERLADTLSELQRPGMEQYRITLRGIWYGDSAVASETATLVRDALASAQQCEIPTHAYPVFNAMHAAPYSGPSYKAERDEAISAVTSALADALAH